MSDADSDLVDELGTRAADLCKEIDAIGGRPQLSRRLRDASKTQRVDTVRPYSVVLLCGPSGGGKSTLFNSLVGEPGASPESGDQRCCTRGLIVACSKNLEALCRGRWPDATLVERRLEAPGLVLIDSPDVNGPNDKHRECTSNALHDADVAVWVSSSMASVNIDSARWLQSHAAGRRWWVVGTLRDEGEDPQGVRESIRLNGRRVGIEDGEAYVYVFDTKRGNHDYARFRDVVLRGDYGKRIAVAAHELKLEAIESAYSSSDRKWFGTVGDRFREIEQTLLPQARKRYAALFWDGSGARSTGIGPSLVRQLAGELRRRVWLEAAERTLPPVCYVAMLRARVQGALVAWNLFRGVTGGFGIFRMLSLTRAWLASRWVEVAVERVLQRHERGLTEINDSINSIIDSTIRQHGLTLTAADPAMSYPDANSLIQDFAADVPWVGAKWARRLASMKGTDSACSAVAAQLSQALDGELDRQAEVQAGRSWWPISLLGCLAAVPLVWAAVILLETAYRREWLPTAFYLHAAALMALATLPASICLVAAISRVRCDEHVEQFLRNPRSDWLPASRAAATLADRIERAARRLASLSDDAGRLRAAMNADAGETVGFSLRSRSPVEPASHEASVVSVS
jgi:hypothetical protein